MNKAKLKSYASQARKDFIGAVTARANLLGLSEKEGKLEVATSQPQGNVTVIAGQAWPLKVHHQRQQLISRIQKEGFTQTMEAVAYTWFNRFAALRYMELHDYLGHGHRALSSRDGSLPDILTHAIQLSESGELPGLKAAVVAEMKLAGNRDGELYRLLLTAQCNALSTIMPFLFERIDDETELLLPDNLLRTDSVIAKLVGVVDEEDWTEVEIVGWLYQFYISEKKDEVIGKVVRSEDIPAATQLFTPNWIVQYMVQNTVGRLWLMANPSSTLNAEWKYFITPAGQTPEVEAQLNDLVQTRIDEGSDSLNPESITLLDPACGSGHILVEAYNVLKAIYLERGYQPRVIPRLILEKNLYGLDIDDRAAQMAGFALLMKARADDRRLFNEPVMLNVLSFQESKGFDVEALTRALQSVMGGVGLKVPHNMVSSEFGDGDLFPGTRPQLSLGESTTVPVMGEEARQAIAELIATFSHAKTFGSLIQIPQAVNEQLPDIIIMLRQAVQSGDLYAKAAARDLLQLVAQTKILGRRFDAVVANPPYMGSKFYSTDLKNFVGKIYPSAKSDLYTCFLARSTLLAKKGGYVGMITIPNWMFLSSFEDLRNWILSETTIETFCHNGRGVFGSDFGSCAFTFRHIAVPEFKGTYKRLFDKQGSVASNEELQQRFLSGQSAQSFDNKEYVKEKADNVTYKLDQKDLQIIPGWPLAYWLPQQAISAFSSKKLCDVGRTRRGLQTGHKDRFIRYWYECDNEAMERRYLPRNSAITSNAKWFMFNNGGDFRKWYGNLDLVVNWEGNGKEIKEFDGAIIPSEELYFSSAVSWSRLTSGANAFRMHPEGVIPGDLSPCYYSDDIDIQIAYLNSKCANYFLNSINPSVTAPVGDVAKIPVPMLSLHQISVLRERVNTLIRYHKDDWDSVETSWGFHMHPLIKCRPQSARLSDAWEIWAKASRSGFEATKCLEEENNRLFIEAFSLQNELTPDVSDVQITLGSADRGLDCQSLVSYAIGCMMGRYSLDESGLIYASAGNIGFDARVYNLYPADADGIVPITDELWFSDDAANRVRELLLAVWGSNTLVENLTWLAESLGVKVGETPDETIRRYLADKFYKNHLQTYKRRPIYWLFSSGKQGAFQALVYLHRYHEGTLARMRAEYVVPLTGKIQSRIDMLEKDAIAATSTAARNKLTKEVEKLKKKHVELLTYDEQLRHYADMRITLDLDDGVKVNYGKFGDLLAEVKAVTGSASDD